MSTCRHLTLVDAFHFISTLQNDEIPSYLEATFCSAKQLFTSSFGFLHSLLFFLYYVLLGIVRLATAIMPQLLSFGSVVVSFHLHQLTVMDICLEVALLTIMVLVYVNNKSIMLYIHSLEESLQKSQESLKQQSQKATTQFLGVAPHCAFFTLAMIFAVLGRRFLSPLSSHMPLFSLVLPIFTTIYGSLSTISHGMPRLGPTMSSIGGERDHERNSDGNNNASQMRIQLADMNAEELQQAAMQGRQTILLWIVLGCYHSIATVCSLVPFAEYILINYLPFIKEMALVVVVWSQLSPLFIEIVYEVTSPSLIECSKRIPSASFEKKNSLVVIETLEQTKIIDDNTGSFLRAALTDGTSLFIIAVFCCTPTYIASFGVILIGLLLPAIRASTVVKEWENTVTKEKEEERAKRDKEKQRSERGRGRGGGRGQSNGGSVGVDSDEETDEAGETDEGLLVGTLRSVQSAVRRSSNALNDICDNVRDGVGGMMRGMQRSLSPFRKGWQNKDSDDNECTGQGQGGTDKSREGTSPSRDAPNNASKAAASTFPESPSNIVTRPHNALTQPRNQKAGSKNAARPRNCHFTIGVFASGRKVQKNERQTRKIITKQRRWMEYFVCIAVLWTLKCYNVSLWPSLMMIISWCLCHSLWDLASPVSKQIVYIVRLLPLIFTPWMIVRLLNHTWGFLVAMLTEIPSSSSHSSSQSKVKSKTDSESDNTNQAITAMHGDTEGENDGYDDADIITTPLLQRHEITDLARDSPIFTVGSLEDDKEGDKEAVLSAESDKSDGRGSKGSSKKRSGSKGPARKKK